MSVWRAPVRGDATLQPVWQALTPYNMGVDHFCDRDGWHLTVDRLVKRHGEWIRHRIVEETADDDLTVVVQALPALPGIACRLALIGVLLGG